MISIPALARERPSADRPRGAASERALPRRKPPHRMHYYRVFGLILESERPLPGLMEGAACEVDISLRLGQAWPDFLPAHGSASWQPATDRAYSLAWRGVHLATARAADGQLYHWLRYPHRDKFIDFVIDESGRRLWAMWPEAVPFADVAAYLVGPALISTLRLRGTLSLHASVVGWRGRALAVVGQNGRGKSTVAAALARTGLTVLSDDVAVLAERGGAFWAQPGLTRLRLSPASAELLVGGAGGLAPVLAAYDDKYYLELTTDPAGPAARSGEPEFRYQPEPLPLAAIYLLSGRYKGLETTTASLLAGGEAFVALAAHSYTAYVLDQSQRAAEFAALRRLADAVPVQFITRPDGLEALPALCETINSDFRQRLGA